MSLMSLSPLDGRYQDHVEPLSGYFSEYGLIRCRFQVEIAWLIQLSECPDIPQARLMTPSEKALLLSWGETFDLADAERIKSIEVDIGHDVKAVEYDLKNRLGNTSLRDMREWVHFCCTSEDITNLAYSLMLKDGVQAGWLPLAEQLVQAVTTMAQTSATTPMLSRTHGQAATPSTLGKELAVFCYRWNRQLDQLSQAVYLGKFNGAVGSYNAHVVAYPEAPWEQISRDFVEGLGLTWNPLTTQIESHDGLAELCHILMRFNAIAIDFARDMWSYISLGYFRLAAHSHQVGSSTMPHKVNPIRFENAEANLSLSSTLLAHLAGTLPISRLQRDLTDSSTLRNIGAAFGHGVVGVRSLVTGLSELERDEQALTRDLESAWDVLGEAIQTVMRKHGLPTPYEQLKTLTRGKRITREALETFIQQLELPLEDQNRLLQLTPATYTGRASLLVRHLSAVGGTGVA